MNRRALAGSQASRPDTFSQSMPILPKILFVLALALSFMGLLSQPIALTAGILFDLSSPHPYINESRGGRLAEDEFGYYTRAADRAVHSNGGKV